MTLPESFDRSAILDATLTDMLSVKGIDFEKLSASKKFDLRDNLLPVLNAMAPHIHAQLKAAEAKGLESLVVPDTLEGLFP